MAVLPRRACAVLAVPARRLGFLCAAPRALNEASARIDPPELPCAGSSNEREGRRVGAALRPVRRLCIEEAVPFGVRMVHLDGVLVGKEGEGGREGWLGASCAAAAMSGRA